ncbi:MAG: ATP-binding protein [Candidatus Magnetominusculus sp. LBB02]|nr:ATP-binding protein [Candidatus Magnetominusculus sp. LBB02]
MLKFTKIFWPSKIRYQLIVGVALVHLFLMTVFVTDLVWRQRNFLLDYSRKGTESLAMTLAVNSSTWVIANDVAGLSEIISSMKQYPGIKYAMIISPDGRVLAHVDSSKQGLFLADNVSLSLLNAPPKLHTVFESAALLDIAAPITAAKGDLVGWARIGMGNAEIMKNLNIVSRNGVFYTLFAILAGSIFAVIIGNRLVKGLSNLVSVVARIRDGDRSLSIPITHDDEIADLSEGFNQMLSAISLVEEQLHKTVAELNQLSGHLAEKINEEVEKNRAKDQLMYDQSRHASMGELLINISHHWRQPLCTIAITIQDIRDAYRHNELNEPYLNKNVQLSMLELQTLSSTIDNFRNFYIRDKEQKEFNISSEINRAEALISGYVKDKAIIIERDMDDTLTIQGYPNEFAHVILNILTNAKDKFEQKNITGGIIRIRLYKDDATGRKIITIADNGGNIPDEIIDRVFDPYFTTKDKSRGTGMGLYMAKIIIENKSNGTISIRNIDRWCELRIELD